jgi:hypothetical protein
MSLSACVRLVSTGTRALTTALTVGKTVRSAGMTQVSALSVCQATCQAGQGTLATRMMGRAATTLMILTTGTTTVTGPLSAPMASTTPATIFVKIVAKTASRARRAQLYALSAKTSTSCTSITLIAGLIPP